MDQAALPAKLSEGQPAALAGRSPLTRPPWSAVLGAAMLSFRRNRPRSLPGCRELWGQDRLRGALDGQGAAGLVPFSRAAHRFGRTPGARSGVSRNVTHPGPGTPQRAPRGLRALPKPWRLPLGRERALQGSQCPASPARHSAPCIPDAEWARGPRLPIHYSRGLDSPLYPHPLRTQYRFLSSRCAPSPGRAERGPPAVQSPGNSRCRGPAGLRVTSSAR